MRLTTRHQSRRIHHACDGTQVFWREALVDGELHVWVPCCNDCIRPGFQINAAFLFCACFSLTLGAQTGAELAERKTVFDVA